MSDQSALTATEVAARDEAVKSGFVHCDRCWWNVRALYLAMTTRHRMEAMGMRELVEDEVDGWDPSGLYVSRDDNISEHSDPESVHIGPEGDV